MTELSEIERRAWANRTSCNEHKPGMACRAALDQISRGELGTVKHVIVVVVEDIEGGDRIHVLQTGELSELASEGALGRALRVKDGCQA